MPCINFVSPVLFFMTPWAEGLFVFCVAPPMTLPGQARRRVEHTRGAKGGGRVWLGHTNVNPVCPSNDLVGTEAPQTAPRHPVPFHHPALAAQALHTSCKCPRWECGTKLPPSPLTPPNVPKISFPMGQTTGLQPVQNHARSPLSIWPPPICLNSAPLEVPHSLFDSRWQTLAREVRSNFVLLKWSLDPLKWSSACEAEPDPHQNYFIGRGGVGPSNAPI